MCAHSNSLGNKQLAIKKQIPSTGFSPPSSFSAPCSFSSSLSALEIAAVVAAGSDSGFAGWLSAKPLEFLTGEGLGNAAVSGCKLWATFVSSKPHQCGVRYNPGATSHRSNELVGRKKKGAVKTMLHTNTLKSKNINDLKNTASASASEPVYQHRFKALERTVKYPESQSLHHTSWLADVLMDILSSSWWYTNNQLDVSSEQSVW